MCVLSTHLLRNERKLLILKPKIIKRNKNKKTNIDSLDTLYLTVYVQISRNQLDTT